jgi:hypothetical protein
VTAALVLALLAAEPATATKSDPLTASVEDFTVEGLNRTQLLKLQFQLNEQRPGLGGVAMLASGIVLDVLGAISLTAGAVGLGSPTNNWFKDNGGALGYTTLTFGVIGLVAGVALTVWGAISTSRALPLRRLGSFKLQMVNEALAKQPAE